MAVFQLDPVEIALDALGKERTLTGRSILWEYAMTQNEMQPWLGNGFDAFWNGGIATTGQFVPSGIQSEVKNLQKSYLDITMQVGAFELPVALGILQIGRASGRERRCQDEDSYAVAEQ